VSYPEPSPLTGAAKILGTVSLALATFMNVLDTSIANVSLSSIGGDLGVSITQATWVITSFGVANAIAVPLTGWLSQRFGAVRLFTASLRRPFSRPLHPVGTGCCARGTAPGTRSARER
jgi:DHA2 family multidrug resistance protein